MRNLPRTIAVVVGAAFAAGCSAQRGYSAFSDGSSFDRDHYFVKADDIRDELIRQCEERRYLVTKHPTGVLAKRFDHDGLLEFTYFGTVVEQDNKITMWFHGEFPCDRMPSETQAELEGIEKTLVDMIKATKAPDNCRYYSMHDHRDAPSVARIELTSANLLAGHQDEIVTIRGSTERRKNGIYMVGSDVLVRIPQWCDPQEAEPQWFASVKGRLRLVREAGMYESVNDKRQPGDPLVQDVGSGPMPALYELVP